MKNAKQASIVTHVNPDGDAIGTSLALAQCLKQMGLDATVIVPNPFPEFLQWIEGTKDILIYKHGPSTVKKTLTEADLIFCVDLNGLGRLENMGEFIATLPAPRVLIDHHLQPATEEFAVVFSKIQACSSAEVLFQVLKEMQLLSFVTPSVAEAIYTGIMTDTNGFQNNCTRPGIFSTVAELLQRGVDKEKVYESVYSTYSEERMRLLGYALYEKMVVLPEYRTAYIALSREEIERFKFQPGDTEGFVNYPLHIKNIVFSAFLSENQENVRISLRSRGSFSVNDFARIHFEGGGHLNAAGGTSSLPIAQAIDKFVESLKNYKDALVAL